MRASEMNDMRWIFMMVFLIGAMVLTGMTLKNPSAAGSGLCMIVWGCLFWSLPSERSESDKER